MIADVEKKRWSSCGSGRLAGLPLRVHSHSCSLSESQCPIYFAFLLPVWCIEVGALEKHMHEYMTQSVESPGTCKVSKMHSPCVSFLTKQL